MNPEQTGEPDHTIGEPHCVGTACVSVRQSRQVIMVLNLVSEISMCRKLSTVMWKFNSCYYRKVLSKNKSNGSDERRVRMYRKEDIGSQIRIGSDGSDKRRVNVCQKSCGK